MIHLILLAQLVIPAQVVTIPATRIGSQQVKIINGVASMKSIVVPATTVVIPAQTIPTPAAAGGCAASPTAPGCKVLATVTATCTTYSDGTFACTPVTSATVVPAAITNASLCDNLSMPSARIPCYMNQIAPASKATK